MSEAVWSVAPPRDSATSQAETAPSADALDLPIRFRFSTRCRLVGASTALGAACLLSIGLFLLSQVSSTPVVAAQLCIVGLLLTAAGAVVLHIAARRLFGVIRVDENGVSFLPQYSGFEIPWSRLERWLVKDSWLPARGLPLVRFWVEGDPLEKTIPADALSDDDVRRLRSVLKRRAPERELKF